MNTVAGLLPGEALGQADRDIIERMAERATVVEPQRPHSEATPVETRLPNGFPTRRLPLHPSTGNAAIARFLKGAARPPTALLLRGNGGTTAPQAAEADAGADADTGVGDADTGVGDADTGVGDARDEGATFVRLGAFKIYTDDEAQRRAMKALVAQSGRAAPREFVAGAHLELLDQMPIAGPSDDLAPARDALIALDVVVNELEADIDKELADFDQQGHAVLGASLDESETRTKAEALKYGLTAQQVEEWTTVGSGDPPGDLMQTTRTVYTMDKEAPAGKGLAAAAKVLIERRARLQPLFDKIQELQTNWARSMAPGGTIAPKPAGLDEAQTELKVAELEYDALASELTARYPILGPATKDKGDLSGLQTLQAGPSANAAQFIGEQIQDTMVKIDRVRAENKPGGEVDIFKVPKVVALTKAQKNLAVGTWQNKVVDEHVQSVQAASELIAIALGLVNLALVLLAPVSGSVTLIVAAGLSAATAVEHAQEYMLEEAMAGSDLDKAHALSQDDPSLFWLAVDIVAAMVDIGAAAAAASKLLGAFRNLGGLAREAKAAKTIEEGNEALARLKAAAKECGGDVLAERIVKSLEADGKLAGISKELETVEAAAGLAEAELKVAGEAASEAGHVHVTKRGKIFSCSSPCAEIRAKHSELIVANPNFESRVADLEKRGAALGENAMKSELDGLAKEAAKLDNDIVQAATKARAQKIATWLPALAERYPVLKDFPLDAEALARIIRKTNPAHIKGQLLEELMSAKVRGMLATDAGKATLAGERAGEALDFIEGHRITDVRGKQFTDGMIIVRRPGGIEVVTIMEAKAGKASSRGLKSAYTSLKELDDEELRIIRMEAIQEFRDANVRQIPALKGMSSAEIDAAYKTQIDSVLDRLPKSEAGEAVADIERLVEIGTKIDGAPVKVVKGGRGSTKVMGAVPKDVSAEGLKKTIAGEMGTVKGGQGMNFDAMNVDIRAKDLDALASEIAARAASPTL